MKLKEKFYDLLKVEVSSFCLQSKLYSKISDFYLKHQELLDKFKEVLIA